jgi:hypothetical protein
MKLANRHLDENRAGQSSRRRFLKAGAAFAVAAPFLRSGSEAGQRPQNADDAGTLERVWRQSTAPNQFTLLRGGTVVTMDQKVGDFVRADVLIRGKKIAAEYRTSLHGPSGPPPRMKARTLRRSRNARDASQSSFSIVLPFYPIEESATCRSLSRQK